MKGKGLILAALLVFLLVPNVYAKGEETDKFFFGAEFVF